MKLSQDGEDYIMSKKERRKFATELLDAVNKYFMDVDTPERKAQKEEQVRRHAASLDHFNRTGQLLQHPSPSPALAEQRLREYLKGQIEIIKPAGIRLSMALDRIIRHYVEQGYQRGYFYDCLLKNTCSQQRGLPHEVVRTAAQRLQATGLPPALKDLIISEVQDIINTVEVYEREDIRALGIQGAADRIYFRAFKSGLMVQ
ncbi:Uncharacterised protein [uncultured archaeon]|nr:Uncharacterised protein [uncultured archaeon]